MAKNRECPVIFGTVGNYAACSGRKEKGENWQLQDSNPGCLAVAAITTEPQNHHSNQPSQLSLHTSLVHGTAELQSHTGETKQLCGFNYNMVIFTN